MIDTDVVVVGAGPAGTAAAITLARDGRSVVVLDRARFPRDKCCGDGLTTLALRELEALGFDHRALPSWRAVDAAWVRSPSGRTVEFPLPATGTYAAVVPRVEFDAALVDLARAAGAKVHDGHAVTGADTSDSERVIVDVDGLRQVASHYAIGADGMWSPLRKAIGAAEPGYRGEWHAFRQYFGGVTGTAAKRLWVWFEPDLLPGYAWSFPLPGGRANVGFGILRGGQVEVGDMAGRWVDVLARPHIRDALGPGARAESPHKAWPIPARVDRAVLGRGRVLFAGDAAAATDALTGEGIGQALLTGRLAAEAILGAGAIAPDAAQATYAAAVRGHLLADHRMSVALGRLLAHRKAARGAVRVAGATDWTRRSFARWLFEDEPRAIALTPRRWHRRFLRRSGAYADPV